MRHAELPTGMHTLRLEPFDAASVVNVAHKLGITVAGVFRQPTPFARALTLPSLTNDELSVLERRPDEWDLVALTPIDSA